MKGVERWLPVVGFEGLYEVSDLGRVRSLGRVDTLGRRRRPKLMDGTADGEGYISFGLTPRGDGPQRAVCVRGHVLVLEAFVGPRPEGMEACHADDIPSNNTLANLRWDTPGANQADQRRNRSRATAHRSGRGLRPPEGFCCRGHRLAEPNLTRANAHGRRRCLACQRGHNTVKDAARCRGERLDLQRESDRHYAQLRPDEVSAAGLS